MAITVSGAVQINAFLSDQRTQVTGALGETGGRNVVLQAAYAVVSGTAAGQIDRLWMDTRTLTTGASENVDVRGTIADSFGAVVDMVKVKGVFIAASGANTVSLTVTKGASGVNYLTGTTPGFAAIGANGMVAWLDPNAGVAATAGSSDLIVVTNAAGASSTYSILVVGTSA